MRWFRPQLMPKEHFHGHIELNWLTTGNMDYIIDGHPLSIPSERLVMFWAGIPHRTISVDRGPRNDGRPDARETPRRAPVSLETEWVRPAFARRGVPCDSCGRLVGKTELRLLQGCRRGGETTRR
jgi:hypothetical protein